MGSVFCRARRREVAEKSGSGRGEKAAEYLTSEAGYAILIDGRGGKPLVPSAVHTV